MKYFAFVVLLVGIASTSYAASITYVTSADEDAAIAFFAERTRNTTTPVSTVPTDANFALQVIAKRFKVLVRQHKQIAAGNRTKKFRNLSAVNQQRIRNILNGN